MPVSFPVDYCHSSKSIGKETGKTHLCALGRWPVCIHQENCILSPRAQLFFHFMPFIIGPYTRKKLERSQKVLQGKASNHIWFIENFTKLFLSGNWCTQQCASSHHQASLFQISLEMLMYLYIFSISFVIYFQNLQTLWYFSVYLVLIRISFKFKNNNDAPFCSSFFT